MYSVIENARIVLALLKKHNIRHIVVSPGGSNIPIVQGVQDDPFFKCYSVVDERSAMYVAIGIYLETGEIVATSCTSAQATRNYIPGLTEAFYKRVPILAITTSKHPLYVGQEYMQSPIQTSLPVDAVKKSFSLPRITSAEDRELCVRRTNEAILELTHHGYGPVQLNLEVLDSETWSLGELSLPDVKKIERYYLRDLENVASYLNDKNILIVIGEHPGFNNKEAKIIDNFCEKYNTFVYTSHISNYHGTYAMNALPVIVGASTKLFEQTLMPDLVICIGGITGDYDLFFKLSYGLADGVELWRVNLDGDIIDTYGRLTKVFQMNPVDFFDFFVHIDNTTLPHNHEYHNAWKTIMQSTSTDEVELPFSNVYAAQQLHNYLPENSNINFGILNSFRSWLYYNIHPSIKGFCNVGGFGIDGCLSTMIGQSLVSDNRCFIVLGDLSFLYDMNSIAIRHIKNNVRILLCNNNGGVEFKINQIHNQIDVSRYVAADGHFHSAKAWAEDNGYKYMSADSKESFNNQISEFVQESDAPIIYEIFTNPEAEKEALTLVRKSCVVRTDEEQKNKDKRNKIKNVVTSLIGDKGLNVVKNILKK